MRTMRSGALASLAVLGAVAASGPSTGALPEPLVEDRAVASGLGGERAGRVSFVDLDGDGFPDVVLDGVRFYRNVPCDPSVGGPSSGRRFERLAGDVALASSRGPALVQLADLDGDGRPDLYLGRSTDPAAAGFVDDGLRSEIWLQRGTGAATTFVKVESSGVGAHVETTVAACCCDLDGDGVLDLFTGAQYTAYGKSLEAYPSRLYRGRGDGTFEDVTERAGLLLVPEAGRADSRRPTYGVTHFDWNEDGRQDLVALSYGRQANRLWRNDGGWRFTDVAPATSFDGDGNRDGTYPRGINRPKEPEFRSHGNHFDAAIGDVNGDGHLDVFLATIAHWWAGPSSDPSMLLVNRGPEHGFAFERRPDAIRRVHEVKDWNQGDLHAGWIDLDNDGNLDLVLASSDYPDAQILRVFHQEEDGRFVEWTERLGLRWVNACQISLGDFDGDGATDFLIARNHMRFTKELAAAYPLAVGLWRNRCPEVLGNRFLTLRLRGLGPGHANRDAIGARVTLWVGGKRQTRIVQGGLGHAGHRDDLDCRFGVGKAETVERLEVEWPDGKRTRQVFSDLATNAHYALEEGGPLRRGRAARVYR